MPFGSCNNFFRHAGKSCPREMEIHDIRELNEGLIKLAVYDYLAAGGRKNVLISVVFALHWLDVAPRVDASKVPADAIADVENVRALRAGIDLARLVRELKATRDSKLTQPLGWANHISNGTPLASCTCNRGGTSGNVVSFMRPLGPKAPTDVGLGSGGPRLTSAQASEAKMFNPRPHHTRTLFVGPRPGSGTDRVRPASSVPAGPKGPPVRAPAAENRRLQLFNFLPRLVKSRRKAVRVGSR